MKKSTEVKKIAWIRRRGSKKILIGAVLSGIVLLLVLTSLFYTPYDPDVGDIRSRLDPPSWKHPFGTDNLGRDVLSRVMSGGQISLTIAACTLIGTVFLGIVCGLLAGYYENVFDDVTNMIAEIRQSMPMLLLIIVFLAIVGASIVSMVIILALSEWVTIFRTVRASTIGEKKMDYVTAAKANGASNFRIIFRYIMPNVLPSVIVLSTLMISTIILEESSLSYLGVGVTRPHPSWGRMISEGQSYMVTGEWWLSIFPALAIALFVLGINLMADGLRQMWKME